MSKPSQTRKKKLDSFFLENEDNCPLCRVSSSAERSGRDLTVEEFAAAALQAGKEGVYIGTFEDNEEDGRVH